MNPCEPTPPPRRLILGSTSIYRRALLERLQLPFDVIAPAVDERPHAGETPHELANRLALEKAMAVASGARDALVIGSDQVADLDGQPLGKPGNHERARQQLQAMRGRWVTFHTAVAAVCLESGYRDVACAHVRVRVRAADDGLDDAAIERYLAAEPAYDCAGSARTEGLGICLLDAIESDDPTAIIGLPLIRTCQLLRAAGVRLP